MNNELPEKYLQWVARVSEIVSFKFPFDENSELRFNDWLYSKWISQKDYMNIAQTWWTEIHLSMEKYMEWEDYTSPLYDKVSNEINHWKLYIDNLKMKFPNIRYDTEVYIRDEWLRFNWTIDLVRVNEETKQVWLYDYKSWEVTKKAFWLETKLLKSWQPWKPTDKLKKLALQLSLYAQVYQQQWYEVMWLYWVWLHDTGCYEYKVEQWSNEEIDRLLSLFFTRKTNLPNNFTFNINWMKIEIQTTIPEELYSKASVVIEEWDLDWMTIEQKIEEAIRLQKHLISKYKDGNL